MSNSEHKPGDSITFRVPFFESYFTYRAVVKEVKPGWLVVDYFNMEGKPLETHVELTALVTE